MISQCSHADTASASSHAAGHSRSTSPSWPVSRWPPIRSARAFIHGMLKSDGPSRETTVSLRSSASSTAKISRSAVVE